MNDKDSKYDLENLPIRDEVKKEIKDKKLAEIAALNMIHTWGRMLRLWEDAMDEQFEKVLASIDDLSKNVKSSQESFRKRIRSLEEKVKVLEEKVA